jgi:protein SCO1
MIRSRGAAAVAALAAILVVTASWWALALWPVATDGPEWVLRTREVCFGATPDGLPEAGGWVLLIGQPLGMLGFLALVWGADLRAGLGLVMARAAGQLAVGLVGALIIVGVSGVVVRVRTAGLEPFSTGAGDIAAQLTRVDDAAPALPLVDQHGREVSLDEYRGRPVLIAFAYAHCATVCPLIVSDVLEAQRRSPEREPAVLVVTLDPWRDTPSRLPSMARQWSLPDEARVLSGEPGVVEHTLNRWRVPRARNQKTGEITHPSLVYVIGPDGRIAYAIGGNVDVISAAIQAL